MLILLLAAFSKLSITTLMPVRQALRAQGTRRTCLFHSVPPDTTATNSSGASLGRERRTREHLESIMSLAASLHETLGQFRDSLGLDIHMRIGVHSGDVVTGIITGSHRPRFSEFGRWIVANLLLFRASNVFVQVFWAFLS